MKTSYSRAWGMQGFHTCIYDIFNYREYGDDIKEPYITNQIFGINLPQQGATPSNESVGEWRRRNERIGR